MSGYYEMMAAREKLQRHVKRAIAYLDNAQSVLHMQYNNLAGVQMLPVEFWNLLEKSLETAHEIIGALPDDFFVAEEVEDFFGLRASILGESGPSKYNSSDTAYEMAKKVIALIEQRRSRGDMMRKIMMLESTDGRTPEEAELYRAKAAELRAGLTPE